MCKITDILGSSVIKQKQRATESPEANINHQPWPPAGRIRCLSSRCIACVCCALAL